MHGWLYIMGLGIGLAASAPVGPVNILAISRALRGGFWVGFTTGLGAVFADSLLAGLSSLGIPWLVDTLRDYEKLVQIIGGGLLILFGIVMTRSSPKLDSAEPYSYEPSNMLAAAISSFMMTITNPGAILAIVTVFSSFGGMSALIAGPLNVGTMVAGMLTGGTLWWAFISWGAATLRERLTNANLTTANRIGGYGIILFGITLVLIAIATGR